MFEAGLWLVGFSLIFVLTWCVGRYLSEKNAIHRVLKRRGYKYAWLLGEENNDPRMELPIARINRRSLLAASKQPVEKLKQAS